MSKGFDITGLLSVAVRDEQSGINFYETLSGQAQAEEVKKLFSWLKEQEQKHAKRFTDLLNQFQGEEQPVQYADQYVDYLEALVSEGGSSAPYGDLDSLDNDVDRLGLAIRYEREQLFLQRDLSNFITTDHKPTIDAIINEERDHLVRLSRHKNKVNP
jgi:rubrerythrin